MANRCVALDIDGKRCRRLATRTTYYFGDSESNDGLPSWVLVSVCDEHNKENRGSLKSGAK